MCLYPQMIMNPKYKPNKKNGGQVPSVTDKRVLYVPIGCKKCIECKKQEANTWKSRLMEDIKTNTNGWFVTLTMSTENWQKFYEEQKSLSGYTLDNWIITRATRLFTERYRKKYKKTIRHWLVSELGHNGTENIHLHGIVWCSKKQILDIKHKIWQYGYVYVGDYVNEQTINYAVKYITKTDIKHKHYQAIKLCSNGIGSNYTNTFNAKLNKYKESKDEYYYVTRTGHKCNLPIYWRNKLYSDEEKEKLWLQKLDKNERFILGEKIKADDTQEYLKAVKQARKLNDRLGYSGKTNWDEKKYEEQMRQLKHIERIEKLNAKNAKGMEDAPF